MKRIFFLITVWASLSAFNSGEYNPMQVILSDNIPWKLKTEKEELQIHFRWLKNQNDQKTRQLKCCTQLSNFPTDFIGKITNPELTEEWLQRLEHCKIIECENENVWYTYMVFDFPWPMSKRDIIIKNTLSKENNEIVIKLEGKENYLPANKGIERMKGFYGYWKISEKNNTLEYSIYSSVKSNVPTWVTDPFIEDNLIESIGTFKDILETEKI